MIGIRYIKIGEVEFPSDSVQSGMLKAMTESRSGFICRHLGTRVEPNELMMDEFEVLRDCADLHYADQPIYTVLGKLIGRVA